MLGLSFQSGIVVGHLLREFAPSLRLVVHEELARASSSLVAEVEHVGLAIKSTQAMDTSRPFKR